MLDRQWQYGLFCGYRSAELVWERGKVQWAARWVLAYAAIVHSIVVKEALATADLLAFHEALNDILISREDAWVDSWVVG